MVPRLRLLNLAPQASNNLTDLPRAEAEAEYEAATGQGHVQSVHTGHTFSRVHVEHHADTFSRVHVEHNADTFNKPTSTKSVISPTIVLRETQLPLLSCLVFSLFSVPSLFSLFFSLLLPSPLYSILFYYLIFCFLCSFLSVPCCRCSDWVRLIAHPRYLSLRT